MGPPVDGGRGGVDCLRLCDLSAPGVAKIGASVLREFVEYAQFGSGFNCVEGSPDGLQSDTGSHVQHDAEGVSRAKLGALYQGHSQCLLPNIVPGQVKRCSLRLVYRKTLAISFAK